MRIALLTAEYPPQPGGVGDYTRCLMFALHEHGQQVAVITGGAHTTVRVVSPLDRHPVQDPSDHRSSRRRWNWRCWPEIIAALDALRPDIFHIQYQTGAYGMHPAINLLPWRLRGLPRRPHIVVTFHDLLEPYLFPKAGRLRRWVTLRLAVDADAVIVTNEQDAKQLRNIAHRLQRFPQVFGCLRRNTPGLLPNLIPIGSNIPVAPPSNYERDAWRAQLGVLPDEPLIAYFGLLSRSKGVDLLLDALRLLRAEGQFPHPPRLLLIGGEATTPEDRAYADEIAAHIDRLALHTCIIRTGQVAEAVVSAHMLAADCLALPFRDGASFRRGSLLAALTHGAAMVTTYPQPHHVTTMSPHLVDGEHALLVPPNDSAALARALHQLLHDAKLRIHVRQHARQLGAQFQWPDIAQRHEEVYARVMALAGARP